MEKLGTVTVDVYKDEGNQYSFAVKEDTIDLSCVKDIIEDTLKYY